MGRDALACLDDAGGIERSARREPGCFQDGSRVEGRRSLDADGLDERAGPFGNDGDERELTVGLLQRLLPTRHDGTVEPSTLQVALNRLEILSPNSGSKRRGAEPTRRSRHEQRTHIGFGNGVEPFDFDPDDFVQKPRFGVEAKVQITALCRRLTLERDSRVSVTALA